MKNIACCIHLSWDFVPKQFMMSCFKMMAYATGKYDLGILCSGGCYMDKVRDALVEESLKNDPDYILWLDADQVYPEDTPEILMKGIDSGKSVVGGVTPLRRYREPLDGKPSVWDINLESNIGHRRDISLNYGLIRVDGMGLGGVMMNPEIFKKLEYPWFFQVWDKEKARRPGVDLQFYGNCKRAGIDVWCDTNLFFEHLETRPIPMSATKGMVEL